MAAPSAAEMPCDRDAMLHAIFVAMDADKSGYVDAEEFKSIFSDVGEKHSDERMAEIDGIRDKGDSDGKLSAEEFCGFMMEYFADLTDKAFREKIAEWEEHIASAFRKLLLRRVFARMDVDKSGSIEYQEFARVMQVGESCSTLYCAHLPARGLVCFSCTRGTRTRAALLLHLPTLAGVTTHTRTSSVFQTCSARGDARAQTTSRRHGKRRWRARRRTSETS